MSLMAIHIIKCNYSIKTLIKSFLKKEVAKKQISRLIKESVSPLKCEMLHMRVAY